MKLMKTLPALAALTVACLVTTGASAVTVPFTYSVSPTLNGVTTPAGVPNVVVLAGGNTLALTGNISPSNTTPTDISLSEFNLVGTPSPSVNTVTFNHALTITTAGGSGTFNISGVFTISNFTNTGALQDVVFDPLPASIAIGGLPFFVELPRFSPDTVNNPTANGGFGIRVTAIPEPASLALVGMGLVGVAGYGVRRRRLAN